MKMSNTISTLTTERTPKTSFEQTLRALNVISGKTNPYLEYERRKELIQARNLSPRDYEKAIRQLSDELRI